MLFYPAAAEPRAERFGPYSVEVALDAEPMGDGLPLVVFSHGSGGTPLVYRDLAAHLARAGFVVALPEHAGNNRNDNSLEGTIENLERRPRDTVRVIDWALSESALAARLLKTGVALAGHSMGGYTALAVAGGRPRAFAHEYRGQAPRPVEAATDERVRALVLLAPAAVWFMAPGALAAVGLPTLLWTAGADPFTPPEHAAIIKSGVADARLIEHRVVQAGGHFAFLSPFPESMRRPGFLPATDPEGFDRAQFQTELYAGIEGFLRAQNFV